MNPLHTPAARTHLVCLAAAVLAACGGGAGGGPGPGPAPAPAISLSTNSLAFSAVVGADAPAPRTITVSNAGGGTLARPTTSVAYASGSGWLSASVSGSAAPYVITVQPVTGALGAGIYTAALSVESAGASNSPQTISVALDAKQGWTVFVYGHADHNLSESLVRDIQEMNAANLGPFLTVVVAADFSSGRTDPTGAPFPSGTEWYRIVGAGSPAVLIGTLPEQNFDDPATLRAAAEAVFASYPARRYGFVLWDHGGSWEGGFGGDENDTPGNPADDGGGMRAADAAAALRSALASAGLTAVRPLDFVSFDTCLMAGNEVAYEFRDLARTFIADAEIDFGNGWDYTAAFTYLGAHPAVAAADFATSEVAAWEAHHETASASDRQVRSHAALDLEKLDAYAASWSTLASAMTASATLDWFAVGRAQFFANPGYGIQFEEPAAFPPLRDAGQLLDLLAGAASDATVAGAASAARAALDASILAASNGDMRTANGQAGVHLEAPLASDWPARRAGYLDLAWNAATGWSSALDALAARADSIQPAVSTVAFNTVDPDAAHPPTVRLGSPDPDIAEARVFVAESLDGAVFFYGIIGLGAVLPGVEYDFVWSGQLLGLGDGATASVVMVLPWIPGAAPIFVVPGLLGDASGSLEAFAVLDASGAVSSVFILLDGRLSTFELADFAGALFTPTLLDFVTGIQVPATPLTIREPPGAPLDLVAGGAAPGTYELITTITDVWGNTGVAADTFTVLRPF